MSILDNVQKTALSHDEIRALPWGHEKHRAIAGSYSAENRDAYLAFVATWKSGWHLLVAAIRQAKRDRSDPAKTDAEKSEAQSRRHYLRAYARAMLEMRVEAKEKNAESRRVRHAA